MAQDSLNTRNAGAFYENLPADEASASAERFEFYDTPKSAGRFDRMEMEFSALSRRCRRMPSTEKLEQKIRPLAAERTEQKIRIDRRFSIESARTRLNSPDAGVQSADKKLKET